MGDVKIKRASGSVSKVEPQEKDISQGTLMTNNQRSLRTITSNIRFLGSYLKITLPFPPLLCPIKGKDSTHFIGQSYGERAKLTEKVQQQLGFQEESRRKHFLNVYLLFFFPIITVPVQATVILGLNYWQSLSNNLTLIPPLAPTLKPPSHLLKMLTISFQSSSQQHSIALGLKSKILAMGFTACPDLTPAYLSHHNSHHS